MAYYFKITFNKSRWWLVSYCVGEYNKPNDIKSNGHESWSLVCKKTITDITLLIKAANSNVSEMGLCNMIIGQMLPSIYMYDKLLGVIENFNIYMWEECRWILPIIEQDIPISKLYHFGTIEDSKERKCQNIQIEYCNDWRCIGLLELSWTSVRLRLSKKSTTRVRWHQPHTFLE